MRAVERALNVIRDKYPGCTVEEICDREGIEIRRCEMGDGQNGLYVSGRNSPVIFIKDTLNPQETHETLAHEIFHHFDKPVDSMLSRRALRDSFLSYRCRREDSEAELFAARFLCPDVSDCEVYHDIMRKYNCSKDLAKLRMKIEQGKMLGGTNHGVPEKER
ncbi:MAG: ImmA/IrrE family metallo-endopeptidase [Bacteroidetes bacterium]|nr:ImmA/IrrE family metallo-endopeptidase [Bacteroidota bacterium]